MIGDRFRTFPDVAFVHDTSVPMIEKSYSASIGDHSDALLRRALLDMDGPAKVVPIRSVGEVR